MQTEPRETRKVKQHHTASKSPWRRGELKAMNRAAEAAAGIAPGQWCDALGNSWVGNRW